MQGPEAAAAAWKTMQDLDAMFAASAYTWDRYALLVVAVAATACEGYRMWWQ